jgi:hypothetical protein
LGQGVQRFAGDEIACHVSARPGSAAPAIELDVNALHAAARAEYEKRVGNFSVLQLRKLPVDKRGATAAVLELGLAEHTSIRLSIRVDSCRKLSMS